MQTLYFAVVLLLVLAYPMMNKCVRHKKVVISDKHGGQIVEKRHNTFAAIFSYVLKGAQNTP